MRMFGLPMFGGILMGYGIALIFPTLQTILPFPVIQNLSNTIFGLILIVLGFILFQLK